MKKINVILVVFVSILLSPSSDAATWSKDSKGRWHFNGEPERSTQIVPNCRSQKESVSKAPSQFYYTYMSGPPGKEVENTATDAQALSAMFKSCIDNGMSALMRSTPKPNGQNFSEETFEKFKAQDMHGHGTLTLVEPQAQRCSDLTLGGAPSNPCNGRAEGSVVVSSGSAPSSSSSSSGSGKAPASAPQASSTPASSSAPTLSAADQKAKEMFEKASLEIIAKFTLATNEVDCVGLSETMCIKLKERITLDMNLALQTLTQLYVAMGGVVENNSSNNSSIASSDSSSGQNSSNESTSSETAQSNEAETEEQREPASSSEEVASNGGSCNPGAKVRCTSTLANAIFMKTCNNSGSGFGSCLFERCNDGFTSGLSLGGSAPTSCELAN